MLHAKFGDFEILAEIQSEYIDGIADVEAGVRHRHEINDQIVLDGESFEFLFIAPDVEVDVLDFTAFHRLIQLLALDVGRNTSPRAVSADIGAQTFA